MARRVSYVGSNDTGSPWRCTRSIWLVAPRKTRTLFPAMVKWDGRCCLRFFSTIRIPFDTLYLYALVHCSSVIACTSPYLARLAFNIQSETPGGRFAIRILRIPISAISIVTCESSLLSCMYSFCPFISFITSSTLPHLANLINTCAAVPPVWSILCPPLLNGDFH